MLLQSPYHKQSKTKYTNEDVNSVCRFRGELICKCWRVKVSSPFAVSGLPAQGSQNEPGDQRPKTSILRLQEKQFILNPFTGQWRFSMIFTAITGCFHHPSMAMLRSRKQITWSLSFEVDWLPLCIWSSNVEQEGPQFFQDTCPNQPTQNAKGSATRGQAKKAHDDFRTGFFSWEVANCTMWKSIVTPSGLEIVVRN